MFGSHIEQKFATLITYLISSGLFLDQFMDYLNEYAAAFGVIFGAITVAVNVFFQWKRSKGIKR